MRLKVYKYNVMRLKVYKYISIYGGSPLYSSCNKIISKNMILNFFFSHVENKHIDCFQYKCPQCRTTKTSRLAIDCHTRSRHNDKNKLLSPLLRLKRQFGLKGEKGGGVNTKSELNKGGYDLMFVTFLR